jgi:NTP pyrophosphatase (non-canonical NTP hydrolase)
MSETWVTNGQTAQGLWIVQAISETGIRNVALATTLDDARQIVREHQAVGSGGVLVEVAAERRRQDAKWGEQNHDPFLYGAILTEEVGEAMQAALKMRFEGGSFDALRTEVVQVAAVAVAMLECLDRAEWDWGNHAPPLPQEVR